jgi:DNA-binding GntR family transcriptional regulator
VREALVQLRTDGYVSNFPRRGYQVTPLTLADMRELFELRIIVEAGAAELAAQRISPEELQELRRLAAVVYKDTEVRSLHHFVSTNREFHGIIAKATRNERLHQLVLHHVDLLERFFYIGAQVRDVNSETETHHHLIVDLLEKRDTQGARKMMIEHNEATRRGLVEAMARSPYSTLIRS